MNKKGGFITGILLLIVIAFIIYLFVTHKNIMISSTKDFYNLIVSFIQKIVGLFR